MKFYLKRRDLVFKSHKKEIKKIQMVFLLNKKKKKNSQKVKSLLRSMITC
jgi:hypothetical protein